METYRKQNFQGRSFILEEVVFMECKLTDCDLFYSGGDSEWVNCQFENCRFHWRGAAKNTIREKFYGLCHNISFFCLVPRQDHRSCRVNVEFSMAIFPWLSGTFTVIVYGYCHPIWITSWPPRTSKVPAFSGSSWAAAA